MGNTNTRVEITDEITIIPLYWASQLLKTFTREQREKLVEVFTFKRKRVSSDGSVHVNDHKNFILSLNEAPIVQVFTKCILPSPLRPRSNDAVSPSNSMGGQSTSTPKGGLSLTIPGESRPSSTKPYVEFALTLNNISCIDFDLACKELAPSILVYQVVRKEVKGMSMTLSDVLKQNIHSVDVMKQDAFQDAVYIAPIGALYDIDYEKLKIIRRECTVMKESVYLNEMNKKEQTSTSTLATTSTSQRSTDTTTHTSGKKDTLSPSHAAATPNTADVSKDVSATVRTLLHQVSFAATVRYGIDAEVERHARRQHRASMGIAECAVSRNDEESGGHGKDDYAGEDVALLSSNVGNGEGEGKKANGKSGVSFGNLSVSIPDSFGSVSPTSTAIPRSQTTPIQTRARSRGSMDHGPNTPVGRRGSILDNDIPGAQRLFVSHSLKRRSSRDMGSFSISGLKNSDIGETANDDDGYLDYIDWVFVLCLGSEHTMPASVELVPVTFHATANSSGTPNLNSENYSGASPYISAKSVDAPSSTLRVHPSSSPLSLSALPPLAPSPIEPHRTTPSPTSLPPLDPRLFAKTSSEAQKHSSSQQASAPSPRDGLGGRRGSFVAPSPRNRVSNSPSSSPRAQFANDDEPSGLFGVNLTINTDNLGSTNADAGMGAAMGAKLSLSIPSASARPRRSSIFDASPAIGSRRGSVTLPSPSMHAHRDSLAQLSEPTAFPGRRSSIIEASPAFGGRRGSVSLLAPSPRVGGRRDSIIAMSPAVGARRAGFWTDEAFSASDSGILGAKTPTGRDVQGKNAFVLSEFGNGSAGGASGAAAAGNAGTGIASGSLRRGSASGDADARMVAVPESRGTVIELTDRNNQKTMGVEGSEGLRGESVGGSNHDRDEDDECEGSDAEEVQPHVVGVCCMNTRELHKKLRTIEKRKEKEGNVHAKYTYRAPIRAVERDSVWAEIFAGEDTAMLITPRTVFNDTRK